MRKDIIRALVRIDQQLGQLFVIGMGLVDFAAFEALPEIAHKLVQICVGVCNLHFFTDPPGQFRVLRLQGPGVAQNERRLFHGLVPADLCEGLRGKADVVQTDEQDVGDTGLLIVDLGDFAVIAVIVEIVQTLFQQGLDGIRALRTLIRGSRGRGAFRRRLGFRPGQDAAGRENGLRTAAGSQPQQHAKNKQN